ncbi:hypothetical protein Y1Q_0024596 [Alligator mississippiensis]|uniref:Uncharacterized protein n=1 Tax=Alligator mississippiensis TaxID=8496 RepID=A0A151NB44_ALLMI|nr:hypothetical protein Y1Q_0024596 [Alligator mississippiensis]
MGSSMAEQLAYREKGEELGLELKHQELVSCFTQGLWNRLLIQHQVLHLEIVSSCTTLLWQWEKEEIFS